MQFSTENGCLGLRALSEAAEPPYSPEGQPAAARLPAGAPGGPGRRAGWPDLSNGEESAPGVVLYPHTLTGGGMHGHIRLGRRALVFYILFQKCTFRWLAGWLLAAGCWLAAGLNPLMILYSLRI